METDREKIEEERQRRLEQLRQDEANRQHFPDHSELDARRHKEYLKEQNLGQGRDPIEEERQRKIEEQRRDDANNRLFPEDHYVNKNARNHDEQVEEQNQEAQDIER